MPLRAVILGIDGVFFDTRDGGRQAPEPIRSEIRRLFDSLRDIGVAIIVLSNRSFQVQDADGNTRPMRDHLKDVYGDLQLYETRAMGLPPKGSKKLMPRVLGELGLSSDETIYVGTTKWDLRTAVNAHLLFANAAWLQEDTPYGFVFRSPAAVRAFVDVVATRTHPWFYAIDNPVMFRSLAPFSTYRPDYELYSRAARRAAKVGSDEQDFFLQSLAWSIYVTKLRFNYVACVPGHKRGFGNHVMDDALRVIAQIGGGKYLPDLIVRHTDAPKSQTVRQQQGEPSPLAQLNTICLTQLPMKTRETRYKHPVRIRGNRVLVVDDFCTAGYSLEACRAYLERAGAEVLAVSWLKTINVPYHVVKVMRDFDPYQQATFDINDIKTRQLPYSAHIADPAAPLELLRTFRRYRRLRAN